MKRLITVALLATVLAATGCATQGKYTGGSYSGSEARRGAIVHTGVIISMSPVTITDPNSGLGALAGAGLAATAAGKNIGAGSGAIVAGVAGGLIGLVAGNAIESQMNTHNAARLVIKLDNGKTISTTQGMDAELAGMRAGDKVFVFDQNGTLRVSR